MPGRRGTLCRLGAAFLFAFSCVVAGGAQTALPAVTGIDALAGEWGLGTSPTDP